MAESKKPGLPVFGGLLGSLGQGPPSLDEARAQLGGAWVGGPGVGDVVRVEGGLGERVGVVVHATPTERDVWIGAGRVQRVEPSRLTAVDDPSQGAIVADVKTHAALSVGDDVVFQRKDGSTGQGVVAEKLRYGSLVGTDDGKVLAIGFRRIAPRQADPPS